MTKFVMHTYNKFQAPTILLATDIIFFEQKFDETATMK